VKRTKNGGAFHAPYRIAKGFAMHQTGRLWLLAVLPACFFPWATALGADTQEPAKYTLRYVFQPGQVLRWEVLQQASVRTSINGEAETVETVSKSSKAWRVKEVKPDGSAVFEHSVDWVDMRQQFGSKRPVRYDSRSGTKPPLGFEDVAGAVGLPLATVTMDATGKTLSRRRTPLRGTSKIESEMTLLLPAEPIPLGHTWSKTFEIEIRLPGGVMKKVSAMQKFTLEEVKTGVARIAVLNVILTPVRDPAVEAQLVQYESAGFVRFDVDAGRVLEQQVDMDKRIVGFRGPASNLHYLSRFTEKFQAAESKLAAVPPVKR
jgi:hypothetical protein